jgi:hypothetical protein
LYTPSVRMCAFSQTFKFLKLCILVSIQILAES